MREKCPDLHGGGKCPSDTGDVVVRVPTGHSGGTTAACRGRVSGSSIGPPVREAFLAPFLSLPQPGVTPQRNATSTPEAWEELAEKITRNDTRNFPKACLPHLCSGSLFLAAPQPPLSWCLQPAESWPGAGRRASPPSPLRGLRPAVRPSRPQPCGHLGPPRA